MSLDADIFKQHCYAVTVAIYHKSNVYIFKGERNAELK